RLWAKMGQTVAKACHLSAPRRPVRDSSHRRRESATTIPAMTRLDRSALPDLVARLTRGERAALARAITLVESRRGDHQALARELIQAVLPRTGGAIRVGIT